MDYSQPVVYSANEDISKNWFIEFYIYNHPNRPGESLRFRKYAGINKFNTIAKRLREAEKKVLFYEQKLASGWTPTIKPKMVRPIDWFETINSFLAVTKDNNAIGTYRTYRSHLKIFTLWLSDHKRRVDIPYFSLEEARAFRAHLSRHKYASNTIIKTITLLVQVVDYAIITHNLQIRNVFQFVKKPNSLTSVKTIISDDDLETISSYLDFKDPTLMMFIRFVFSCFIRPWQELRTMQIKWINFDDETVTIPAGPDKTSKTLTVVIPKGRLLSQIQFLRNHHLNDYVFTLNGIPGPVHIGRDTFKYRFRMALEHLKLNPRYRVYAFKHTGAIKLVKAKVPIKYIQLQMRHSSVSMTDKYLTSMSAKDSEELRNLSYDL